MRILQPPSVREMQPDEAVVVSRIVRTGDIRGSTLESSHFVIEDPQGAWGYMSPGSFKKNERRRDDLELFVIKKYRERVRMIMRFFEWIFRKKSIVERAKHLLSLENWKYEIQSFDFDTVPGHILADRALSCSRLLIRLNSDYLVLSRIGFVREYSCNVDNELPYLLACQDVCDS